MNLTETGMSTSALAPAALDEIATLFVHRQHPQDVLTALVAIARDRGILRRHCDMPRSWSSSILGMRNCAL